MHVSHPCARGWLARCLVFLSLGLAAVAALAQSAGAAGELRVGSKRFTESYILAEIAAQTVRAAGQPAQVRQGLGNTAIVYEALRAGQIDVYPEYTGTIAQEIVKDPSHTSVADLDRALAPMGLGVGVPLGFNNGYALAMRAEQATALGVTKLSDLARLPELKFGLSNEFVGRADGWAGLAKRYGLPQSPRGLDHGLAYEALAQRQIDVMDIYTTDAQISKLGLVVLAVEKASIVSAELAQGGMGDGGGESPGLPELGMPYPSLGSPGRLSREETALRASKDARRGSGDCSYCANLRK